ncbi:hypothetical protein [Nonomuraea rhizosphaerae]|uniref:hypothetical protein n=1 Tax=Nonomuraea rhizosphaerae TaxID=2665663 RepID=UPI001C5F5C06|nr:hypothetical protein [Nonomuraea rhizosphaerae]
MHTLRRRPAEDLTQPPATVQAATTLWLVAVAAGVFETLLTVFFARQGMSAGELAAGVAVRLAVFCGAVFLALRLREGRDWARWTLAVTLGVFGTLSLVIGPIQWLLEGHPLSLAGIDATGLLFGGSRVLHVLAVLGAVTLMFQPRANAYFRAVKRA